ncbi:MAG: hypothetical protein JXR63_00875 [Spirochaetales bacterium]|nr:hypothetical protein [Spirochaetales bacterium]
MKRISGLAIFFLIITRLHAFDINKDNFSIKVDIGEYLVANDEEIFLIEWFEEIPTIINKSKRQDKILNANGYSSISIGGQEYFIVELNGRFFSTQKSDYIKEDFTFLEGQVQVKKVNASSELLEKSTKGETLYRGIFPLFRLTAEKPFGYFINYNGLPWVPDVKRDKIPYLDIELEEAVETISLIPGFLDFKRQNLFYDNSRVKSIEITNFETNKSLGVFILEDKIKYTTICLSEEVKNFRIKIIDTYPGKKYNDPCISSIIFNFGKETGDYGLKDLELFKNMGILK